MIDLSTNTIRYIDDPISPALNLRLPLQDFFYFNQTASFGDHYFSLGKDHMHVIRKDLSSIVSLKGEGDYSSAD